MQNCSGSGVNTMIITLAEQTLIFLYSCLLGVFLSCYFDLFQVVRLIGGNRKTLTLICDLLFFLSAALFTYLFFVRFCSGQIRIYGLIGELLGFLICHFSISALFMKFADWIVRLIRRFLRLLSKPWIAVFKYFRKKFQKHRASRAQKWEKHEKNLENNLQPPGNVVYNLLKLHQKRKEGGCRS